jgi:hypothetical protein
VAVIVALSATIVAGETGLVRGSGEVASGIWEEPTVFQPVLPDPVSRAAV